MNSLSQRPRIFSLNTLITGIVVWELRLQASAQPKIESYGARNGALFQYGLWQKSAGHSAAFHQFSAKLRRPLISRGRMYIYRITMKAISKESYTGYLPDGEAKAVLVLMHGYGVNERDMLGPAREYAGAIPGLACFSLRAPYENEDPALAAQGGLQWFSLEQFRPWEDAVMSDDVFAKETDEVCAYIEKSIAEIAALCGIAPERSIVAGFSQGAVMAAGYAYYSGKRTLGIIAFSGLAAFCAKKARFKVPTLVVHGTNDDIVPIALFEKVKEQLKAVKTPAQFLEIKGLGHTLNREGIEAGAEFIRKLI